VWGEVVILAAVQALTEFLPVSSSGHLVLVSALAGWNDPFLTGLTLSVALHVGTGLALVIALWSDWVWLARGLIGRGDSVELARRLLAALVGSTLLIGVVAFPLRGWLTMLRDPMLAAVLLIVFGLVLAAADRFGTSRHDLASTPFALWVAVGLSQFAALIPGVSRAGITMTVARGLGVERQAAARFSLFLLAPAVAGAGLVQFADIMARGSLPGDIPLLVGATLVAAVVGAVAVRWLLRFVARHSLIAFAAYRVGAGALALFLLLALRA
jgi:undecaprenyl-diphosphatase